MSPALGNQGGPNRVAEALAKEMAHVLSQDVPWETYSTAKLISGADLARIQTYDKKTAETRSKILEQEGPAYCGTLLAVIRNITKEDVVLYALVLIHQLLQEDESRAAMFHVEAERAPYAALVKLLTKEDVLLSELACRVLVRLLAARPEKDAAEPPRTDAAGASSSQPEPALSGEVAEVVVTLMDWLCGQLRRPPAGGRGVAPAVWALATLLRERSLRGTFLAAGGPALLVPLLRVPAGAPANIQLLYEACFCVWLLTFVAPAADALVAARVLPALMEVAKVVSKEKVVRMVVLALRNLLDRADGGTALAEANALKVVAQLQQGNWTDEELVAALSKLEEEVAEVVKEASTFEKYRQEVLSGTLDWTPIHKDVTFWRENVAKFDQQNHQVLRVVVKLMEVSREARTLAVACHDLSMFMQHHAYGKHIVQELGGKELAMTLMAHPDAEVQKQALLAVQKLMIHNWAVFQA